MSLSSTSSAESDQILAVSELTTGCGLAAVGHRGEARGVSDISGITINGVKVEITSLYGKRVHRIILEFDNTQNLMA